MAEYTPNLNLKKMEPDDFYNIEDFNYNIDKTDSHKHKTSDIRDFPTSLPADGGDADTVGGKGITDFVQNYKQLKNGTSILDWATSVADDHSIVIGRLMNPTDPPTGYVAGDCDFWCEVRSIHANKQYIQVKIRDIRSNVEYINTKLVSTWTGWTRANDGGNAAKLGHKTSDSYVQWLGNVSLEIIQNSDYRINYEGNLEPATASSIGLTANWWHVKYQGHTNSGGYGIQQFYPLNSPTQIPRYRTSSAGAWDAFKRIGDSCNADMVDGLHFGVLTQAAYDALATKDPQTIYFTV